MIKTMKLIINHLTKQPLHFLQLPFRGAGPDEPDVLHLPPDHYLRLLPVWERRGTGTHQRPLHPRPQYRQR